MKTTRKITALLVVFIMVMSISVGAASYKQRFWDVSKDHWAFEYIADLTNRGVIAGYEDGSFKPDTIVTRSEWAKMMCVAGNLAAYDNNVYFRDTKDHWANAYINAARNYINSYNDSSFRPNQAITREDVTRSLVVLRGYDTSDVDYSYIAEFKDFDSISNYMKSYVAVAVEKGLITGFDDNTFRGQSTLSRAEAATLLYRAFQKGDASKLPNISDAPYIEPELEDEEPSSTGESDKVIDDDSMDTESSNQNDSSNSTEPSIEDSKGSSDSDKNADRGNHNGSSVIEYSFDADAQHPDNIATNGKDTIYYMSGRRVVSYNVNTQSSKCEVDLDLIEVDTDSSYKGDFQLYSICFDKYTEGLLLFGHFEVVNSSTDLSDVYIYSVTDKGINVLTTNIPSDMGYLIGVLDNGDLVTEKAVYNRSDMSFKYNYAGFYAKNGVKLMKGKTFDFAEKENALHFVGIYEYDPNAAWGETEFKVCEYDYNDTTQVWNINSGSWGISTDKVISWDGEVFNVYNLRGKLLDQIAVEGKKPEVLTRILILDKCFAYYNFNDKTLNVVPFAG